MALCIVLYTSSLCTISYLELLLLKEEVKDNFNSITAYYYFNINKLPVTKLSNYFTNL